MKAVQKLIMFNLNCNNSKAGKPVLVHPPINKGFMGKVNLFLSIVNKCCVYKLMVSWVYLGSISITTWRGPGFNARDGQTI